MSIKTNLVAATAAEPLLEAAPRGGGCYGYNHYGEEREEEQSCWKRFLDIEEMKYQVLFSLPMILTNVSYYAITLFSVMVAGHLGKPELAGATLANSWATVTGFAFMIGLSGALETLCGQGYGAKVYRMLGIYLQASCIISFLFSIIVSVVWLYTEHILIFIHQSPDIAKSAAIYTKYLIPGLIAFGFIQNILRFLQSQSVVMPLVLCSALPVCLQLGIAYALVHWTSLGYIGAPLAASISLWISFIMLSSYVLCSSKIKNTWGGFSSECFSFILMNLKLALPSAAMVCLEYWAFEILVFLAGIMPNSQLTTSLIAMCVNTEAIAFNFTYGLSAAASTRVSNELGAGNVDRAKKAMAVSMKLSILLALIVVTTLAFGHNIWAGFFSNSHQIIKEFAFLTPFLVVSITVDSIQGVLSGVARGCGWQHLAVWANLATFYCIGMPIAAILGFKFKLYAKGLWIGLICGLSAQASSLLMITLCRKWRRIDMPDNEEKEHPIFI